MTVYSWLEANASILQLSVLPCGGRNTLLEVFDRRHELAGTKVAFLADQDMWLFSGIPNEYCGIVFTHGYSIENDLICSRSVDRLLDDSEKKMLVLLLRELANWFSCEVTRYLAGSEYLVDIHINKIVPLGATSADVKFLKARGLPDVPKKLLTQIRRRPRRFVRGHNVVDTYLRLLSAPSRKSKYSRHNVLELASKRSLCPTLKTLLTKVVGQLS